MKIRIFFITTFFILFYSSQITAEVYTYGKGDTIIGLIKSHKVKENESLIEIARKYDVGYNEIVASNPGIDPFIPDTGTSVTIPTSWILPDVSPREGIVINLSEMRLYYFFEQKKSNLVKTYPIGIGSEGNNTPEGKFSVIQKIVKPSWYVPESIRQERPFLPKVVPPGRDNPLGSHALRLSLGTILIHGTNKPYGIGRRVSHGCIRLYPEDIPELFKLASIGTKVAIIRQPLKIGIENNKVYIEVHKDEKLNINYFNEAERLLRKKNLLKNIDTKKLYDALEGKKGIPVKISN
jgi:L,D-transpeptidase ErfK/SrfK